MSNEMTSEEMNREVEEAIAAGERALTSLKAAREKLDSARSWGIWDMVGGGFITNMIKHSRMNDAASLLESAKRDLRIFQKEVRDVSSYGNLRIEVDGFLSFADFFFDGFLTDYLVQTRIVEARNQVGDAIVRVEGLLRELKQIHGC